MERLKQQLQAEEIRFAENEPLSAHCTFKIGGPADVFVQPETEEQLCRVIALCKACDVKYYLLGNGRTSCLRMRATGAWSWIPRL